MKGNLTDIVTELRHADPAQDLADGPLDDRARADLDAALAADREQVWTAMPGRHFSRRTVLGGVGVATAGALVLVVVQPFDGGTPARAAIPLPLPGELREGRPAADALRVLADHVDNTSALPGDATIQHVRTESWHLWTRDDREQGRSTIVPQIRELRWNQRLRSGSARTILGDPYPPDLLRREPWQDREPSVDGEVVSELTWASGEYQPIYPEPLSAEPDTLLGQLTAAHPLDQGETGQLITAVSDLYDERMPTPAVRAAVLRVLAERPDVRTLGTLDDRRGRLTVAFFVDTDSSGLPTRMILMFDPATGRLLADEQILTERPGKLRVPIPSVISYTLYL